MAVDWRHIEEITDEYRRGAAKALNVEQFNLFAITHHSTKIEGSTLTQEETNALLEKGTSIGGKPIEHQNMVLDHQEALVWLIGEARRRTPVTIGFLQTLSAKVMRRTGKLVNSVLGNTDESRGDLRKVNVSAGGYYFVDQSKVEPLMKMLVSELTSGIASAESIQEILTLAFIAHFDLVSIHPFTDGNGRISRLLMNYVQAWHGQPMTVVNSKDRPAYIEALNTSREKKSTDPIIEFLADQHVQTLEIQIKAFDAAKSTNIKNKDSDQGYSMIF